MRYRESPPRSPPFRIESPSLSPSSERFPPVDRVSSRSYSRGGEEIYGDYEVGVDKNQQAVFNFDQSNNSFGGSSMIPRPPPKPIRLVDENISDGIKVPDQSVDIASLAATVAMSTAHLTNLSVSPMDPDKVTMNASQQRGQQPSQMQQSSRFGQQQPPQQELQMQNFQHAQMQPPQQSQYQQHSAANHQTQPQHIKNQPQPMRRQSSNERIPEPYQDRIIHDEHNSNFANASAFTTTDSKIKVINMENSRRQKMKPPTNDWSPVSDLSPIIDTSPAAERTAAENKLASEQRLLKNSDQERSSVMGDLNRNSAQSSVVYSADVGASGEEQQFSSLKRVPRFEDISQINDPNAAAARKGTPQSGTLKQENVPAKQIETVGNRFGTAASQQDVNKTITSVESSLQSRSSPVKTEKTSTHTYSLVSQMRTNQLFKKDQIHQRAVRFLSLRRDQYQRVTRISLELLFRTAFLFQVPTEI